MTDPHRLVERIRELTERDEDDDELQLRDRQPSSLAQRARLENASRGEPAEAEEPPPS